ncbi:MAG: endospore germination permease [Bacillota bacterium]|nr:endospore germination permease [Bacillota bacterium]
MQNHKLSVNQMVSTIILFSFGSSIILGVSTKVNQDSWISLIVAAVLTIPIYLVYSRIIKLFPDMDFFSMLEMLFGKVIGKTITVILVWYAVHLGSLVLRNFSEFVEISGMPETPQLPLAILMIAVLIYLVKSGIETIGKWSLCCLPIILFIVVLTVVLSSKNADLGNLMPIMEHTPKEIISESYKVFTFPFAECVMFLFLSSSFRKKDNPVKIYMWALLISSVTLAVIIIRNYSVLGPALVKESYFPSYMAARIINIGDFLSRIEGTISLNFLLAGITKMAICIMVASNGISSLFNIENEKVMIVPMSLLTLSLSMVLYKSTMEMYNFIEVYRIYAIPFEIIIPLIIWITAEVRLRNKKPAQTQAS